MRIAEYNNPISSNIKTIINEKGMKQCSVAEKSGFTTSGFNAMLCGRKIIKPCDVKNIANALGVSINDLFGIGERGG